jgi:hypothetical protein
MEEMVQALFEQGALMRNGTVNLTRALAELKIPPNVQAILVTTGIRPEASRISPSKTD